MNSQSSEIKLDPNQCVISTTDKKGRIEHCNDYFIQLSGYSKSKLIGSPHNIIRHSDMPKEAFSSLWSTVSRGNPWMGIVKNRSANGDYYWVDAYVTPIYEDGLIVGYQSVRHKANQADIDRADNLYKKIKNGGSAHCSKFSKNRTIKCMLQGAAIVLPATLISSLLLGLSVNEILLITAVTLLAVLMSGYVQSAQYRRLAQKSRSIFSDPLAQQVYSSYQDEVGEVDLALHFMKSSMKTILNRLDDASENLCNHTKNVFNQVATVNTEAELQLNELESATSAMAQMSIAIQEVARSCDQAAESSTKTDQVCHQGMQLLKESENLIKSLSSHMDQSAYQLRQLHDKSEDIDQVLKVISGIAEQTNLLALNAAIEAARAGDAGRGFAVVADEVRSLASSSQQSTESIQKILSEFRDQTSTVVDNMNMCEQQAQSTAKGTFDVEQVFKQLQVVISKLSSMNTQIASTTEEQSVTANEMQQRMSHVFKSSQSVSITAKQTHEISEKVLSESLALAGLIQRFSAIVR